jgi:polyisoprenoid-binding protein YceI
MNKTMQPFNFNFFIKIGSWEILKRLLRIASVILLPVQCILAQENYATKNGHVSFFSQAPVADVDASSENMTAVLNTSNNEISINIAMEDFVFKNGKMGRDAEKKYLETNRFPKASFKGKLNGKIDYEKPGTYPATAAGKLNVHGVEKQISEKGTVTVLKGGKIKLQSEFRVLLKDYNIETPEILGKKMTQDHVLVKIEATLTEQPKDTASKKVP